MSAYQKGRKTSSLTPAGTSTINTITNNNNTNSRQSTANTLKRNPKFELKKDELVRLLGRFEAELQAKEIALATMKSEKVKTLLYNARFGRLNCNSDPYSALLRDSETIKEDLLGEQIPMKTVYESQLSQLEHLIVQQKKQVQLLKNVLNESDKKLITLMEELESEKHHKTRVQTLQNQLLESQKEKLQLKNDLDNVHFHNKELEQQLVQLLHLLEQEQQRHKQFVVILINERKQLFSHLKSEKEKYKQQIDKILGDSTQDKDVQQQYERKYKQLEDEYEQCKDKLNTKIKQLQMELELVNEKYQQQQLTQPLPVVHQHANVMEQDMNEADTKQTIHVKDLKSHSHQGVKRLESAPPTNVSHIMSEHPNVTITSSTTISTTSDTKSPLPTNSNIRRPAIIPSPRTMQVTSVTTKISSPRLQTPSSPSIPSVSVSTTSSPSSIIEIAPTTTTAIIKRSVIPAIQSRNVNSTESAPLMMSNLRSPSTSHNVQNSSITPTTISSPSSRSIPKLTKNSLVSASNINKPTKMSVHQEHDSTAASVTKRMQLSNNHDLRSSSGVIDDLQNLLNVIHSAVENRLNTEIYPADSHITREYPYKTTTNTSEESTNEQEENVSSFPINQLTVLLRAAQMGEADQLIKLLNLGLNPKNSSPDGTTALHLACLFGHNDCIRHLIFHGADPFIENVLGQTPFKNLTKLDETNELECLKTLVEDGKYPPPTDLLNDCIVNNHQQTFDYLFSLSAETILNDEAILCKVLRTTLRSSNTHFLESLFTIVSVKDFVHFVDATCFITNECLSLLSSLNINNNPINTKPIELAVYLSSSLSATSLSASRERSFSYGIGVIQLTYDMSWLEFEKTIIKVYNEHLAQVDSPFDYTKCTIGITTKSIDVLCLGQYKWLYQDSPDDLNLPYVIVHEQSLQTVNICLKGIESNSTDALAYNYFIPSQNLKNFLRYIEQNTYVGVYGAPHTNKHTLFEGLIRQFEHSPLPSSTPKFKVIRFGFESVSSIDDCIEDLIDADFFQTQKWTTSTKSSKVKHLLYFYNIQNGIGIELLKLLLNGKTVSDGCQMLDYTSEYSNSSSMVYYYPSTFHVFVTLSKRTWSNENDILKQFKWIPFKIDTVPWNGILKRYLWRRMIDYNTRNKLPIDNDLVKTLQYTTNVWQRYNECLQKLSLQDALLGPGIFYDCPMDRESIFDWLQSKWNNVIAPLVRELSMNKCSQTNKKASSMLTSMTSLEINSPYESVACTALYVLLHRTVARECPLTGEEREHYLLNFVGSRLEGGMTSMPSSTASSRASTPLGNAHCDFISIQLE